ncbi:MAG: glycosyltransferase family 4 protein [Hyphomicrobiales bacterium]|nr:glycosyltransferase family 4 protein [Hyphomicrobiales bacterium]
MAKEKVERGRTDPTGHAALRISLVTTSMTDGGAQRVAATLANAWSVAGHSVHIATFEPSGTPPDYTLRSEVTLTQLGLTKPSSGTLDAVRTNLRRIRVLRRHLKEQRPDVVAALITGPNILALLAGLGQPWPTVVSERVHPGHVDIGRAWSGLRRLTYPRADAIVVQTPQISDWLESTLALDSMVIPNPVDLGQFYAADRSPTPRRYRAVAIGRLDRQKGYDMLVAAFARVAAANPEWDLAIYGRGPEHDELEAMIADRHMQDRIRLAGFTRDIPRIYAEADLFVHSARFEGSPNVIQEALAAGRAVVATDCPGATRELLAGGRYGVLVPNEDVDALARTLAAVLPDHARRCALAQAAPAAVAGHAAEAIAERWLALFRSVLERKGSR